LDRPKKAKGRKTVQTLVLKKNKLQINKTNRSSWLHVALASETLILSHFETLLHSETLADSNRRNRRTVPVDRCSAASAPFAFCWLQCQGTPATRCQCCALCACVGVSLNRWVAHCPDNHTQPVQCRCSSRRQMADARLVRQCPLPCPFTQPQSTLHRSSARLGFCLFPLIHLITL